ncbi:MAG: hypothetical protein WC997_17590 [Porticoccaceae bacterium]
MQKVSQLVDALKQDPVLAQAQFYPSSPGSDLSFERDPADAAYDFAVEGPGGKYHYGCFTPAWDHRRIPEDGYYIDKAQPDYDLALLRERIIGDVVRPTPAHPEAGHAVMLAEGAQWGWGRIEPTQIGIIDGVVGVPDTEWEITFNASAFRGPGSRYAKNPETVVSCSGGPGTIATFTEELEYSGRYVRVRFWRWRNRPEADGGEEYFLYVPLWYWRPSDD